MANEQHTPGPWHVETGHTQQNGVVYWQVHNGQDAICQNQFCWATADESVSQANARLIAAAPDMKSDIDEFMRRLGPRWFLEQGWFPASRSHVGDTNGE